MILKIRKALALLAMVATQLITVAITAAEELRDNQAQPSAVGFAEGDLSSSSSTNGVDENNKDLRTATGKQDILFFDIQ